MLRQTVKIRILKGILACWILLFFGRYLPAWGAVAQVEVIHSRDKYAQGNAYPLALKIKIKQGWYLHGLSRQGGAELIPTTLEVKSSKDIFIENVKFPAPRLKKFQYTSDQVEVYAGTIIVTARLRITPNAKTGPRILKGVLKYQPCSETLCLPPETVSFGIKAEIVPKGSATRAINQQFFTKLAEAPSGAKEPIKQDSGRGLFLALLGVFLGGLALNLSPCVYPLIPITVSYFGGRSNAIRGLRIAHGAVYMAGLSITNSALGVAAALGGGMIGSALQSPFVLLGVAGVLVALALSFFGLWELRLPPELVQAASKNFSGLFGTFFMGLTLGVVAAPCLGPFILGLLTYVGQKGDPFLGFLYFFLLSLGLGLPLALLGIFSGAIDKLPVSGEWMLWVRKGFGWVLIGMAVYMLRPLIPGDEARALVVALALGAAGLHLGWLDRTSGVGSARFSLIKKAVGLILIVAAIYWGASELRPSSEGIKWVPYKQGILEEAKREGQPVMLDFYAEWCAPCREMERTTFRDKELVEVASKVKAVRVDLTRKTPLNQSIVKRFGIKGVPTLVFIKADGKEARGLRIEAYVSAKILKQRILKLLEN